MMGCLTIFTMRTLPSQVLGQNHSNKAIKGLLRVSAVQLVSPPFLSVSVLLIPNFLVFCANFSSKLNSSPRLRASAVQLVFSGFSPCLRASVVGFGFGFDSATSCPLWLLLVGDFPRARARKARRRSKGHSSR